MHMGHLITHNSAPSSSRCDGSLPRLVSDQTSFCLLSVTFFSSALLILTFFDKEANVVTLAFVVFFQKASVVAVKPFERSVVAVKPFERKFVTRAVPVCLAPRRWSAFSGGITTPVEILRSGAGSSSSQASSKGFTMESFMTATIFWTSISSLIFLGPPDSLWLLIGLLQ